MPQVFSQAARMLAMQELDMDKQKLAGCLDRLQKMIEHERSLLPGNTVREKSVELIRKLANALKQEEYTRQVIGWKSTTVAACIERYCGRDEVLYQAYGTVFPPDPLVLDRLRQPDGSFKCPECGGDIGKDELDAARNGWRCYVKPDKHCFGTIQKLTRV